MSSNPRRVRRGFSLVELLVVIGVIAVLLALLLPTLTAARRSANKTKCASNLRQLGIELLNYAQNNRGWVYPVGEPIDPNANPIVLRTFGTNVPPHERWPAKVFRVRIPDPLPYDASAYVDNDQARIDFSAEPFTPPVLVCPDDLDPFEFHSYVLNEHLADERIKLGDRSFGSKKATTDVILAGEKRTTERDYYMGNRFLGGASEFERVVEKYRHGISLGSNYLFLDSSVRTEDFERARGAVDPWDIGGATAPPATPSTTP